MHHTVTLLTIRWKSWKKKKKTGSVNDKPRSEETATVVHEAFEAVHENGAASMCWTKHSSGNSTQNSKTEIAWTCSQDSDVTIILPCKTEFLLSTDQIDNHTVPWVSRSVNIFWWNNFPLQWQSKLPHLRKAEAQEVWQHEKGSTKLNV